MVSIATKSCHSDSKTLAPLIKTDDEDLQTSDRRSVEVYIDDIVSKAKPERSIAGKFLGFMVSQKGIEVSPDQVKAVMETPPPRSKKELQRLTGKLIALGAFYSPLH
ncbi:hypothetical protein CK203_063635 [Vitis vinifera]|uniref:Uncharacterized protein n=1 Tax=Vitis vinifera TaxID=29760 RepID=A0A438G4U1_VITVI|nr:hypothetical protein CK203_063635 [Vitis vinifera]